MTKDLIESFRFDWLLFVLHLFCNCTKIHYVWFRRHLICLKIFGTRNEKDTAMTAGVKK
jgi:hypothetical protein